MRSRPLALTASAAAAAVALLLAALVRTDAKRVPSTAEVQWFSLETLLRLETGVEWREKEAEDRRIAEERKINNVDKARYELFDDRPQVDPADVKAAKRADRAVPGPSRGLSAIRRLRQLNGGAVVESKIHREACVDNDSCMYPAPFEFGSPRGYEVGKILGRGQYGTAHLARKEGIDEVMVAKVIKPIASLRLHREIAVLRAVEGGPNIMKFYDLVEDSGDGSHAKAFVFEYANSTIDYHEDYAKLTLEDVRLYLYQALQALAFAHERGVMHRDIKPSNMQIDHVGRKLLVIDWGLSDFYFPGKEYSTRVSTRYYKAPELLFELNDYDYGVDIWSLGCVMGHMVLNEGVLFADRSLSQQITNTAKIVGSDQIRRFLTTYGLPFNSSLDTTLGHYPTKDLREFVAPHNAQKMTPDAIDLLQRFLTVDHHERITAADAMNHPFFDSVRQPVQE